MTWEGALTSHRLEAARGALRETRVRLRRVARTVVRGWLGTSVARRLYASRAALVLPRRGFHPARAYRPSMHRPSPGHGGDSVDAIRSMCFFVGYQRSGHTAVAAVLNGHPQALISHELDLFKWVELGVDHHHLCRLIEERDRWFAKRGRTWEGYDYNVPLADYEPTDLRTIGDKMASISTRRIAESPALLTSLRTMSAKPLRVINVVRNPYDNIATVARRASLDLDEAIDRYHSMTDHLVRAVELLDRAELLVVRHDELVSRPRPELERVWEFLDLDDDGLYLDSAASFIRPPSEPTRNRFTWTDEQRSRVDVLIEQTDVLHGYTFD